MFIKRSKDKAETTLIDVVPRNFDSLLVFDRINGDLGGASQKIGISSARVMMAYAYARRTAVAALYIQGQFSHEAYEYVLSIFKSIQLNTDTSVEFQEQAADDAIAYMNSYHHIISRKFTRALIKIAQEYEVPGGYMDDAALIKAVLAMMHEAGW